MANQSLAPHAKITNSETVDFLVVFSQEKEYREFKNLFIETETFGWDTLGYIPRTNSSESYLIAMIVSGQSTANAVRATGHAIWTRKPRAVILTGICAGLECSKVALGDILGTYIRA